MLPGSARPLTVQPRLFAVFEGESVFPSKLVEARTTALAELQSAKEAARDVIVTVLKAFISRHRK
jgi:hypothetical protein